MIVGAFVAMLLLAFVSLAAYGYDQRRAVALAQERLTAAEDRAALEQEFRVREQMRAKLALARERVNDLAYGRMDDTRRILTQDVPRLQAQIRDTKLADGFRLQARSIYARTFPFQISPLAAPAATSSTSPT